MKKLLTILFVLLTCATFAQTKTVINPPTGNKNTITHFADGLFADSIFLVRPFCGVPNINMHPYRAAQRWGAIGLDTCNHVWYGYDPSTDTWAVFNANPYLAKLTFNYGFLCTQGTYDPNGLDMACSVDTAAINQYVTTIIQNDTTINQIDSSQITYFADSIVLAPPPGAVNGNIWLIGSPATGLFTGREKQIATFNGATYTYQIPNAGDIIAITNPVTAFYKFSATYPTGVWVFLRRTPSIGGDLLGVNEDLGQLGNNALSFLTNGRRRLIIRPGGNVQLPAYVGLENEPLIFRPGLNGKIDTTRFKYLKAGTNITIDNTGDSTIINATGGGSQTWQQTLITGSELTQDNYIPFGAHYFNMQGVNSTFDGGANFIYDARDGNEAIQMGASSSFGASYFLLGGGTGFNSSFELQSIAGTDTVGIAGNATNKVLAIRSDSISMNGNMGGYSLPPLDGTSGQVLTTNGSGTASWQDAGGGGSSIFPTAGGATTLDADVTPELGGNNINIQQDGNNWFQIQPSAGGERVFIQALSSETPSAVSLIGITSNSDAGYTFSMLANDASNTVQIQGDATANTITHTAATNIISDNLTLSTYGSGTHTGTATYGLSVDASGNVIETSGGGGGSPAGNYGNVQLNRNGVFATPASDSLSFNSGVLGIKGTATITGTSNPLLTVTNSDATSFATLRMVNSTGNLAQFTKLGTSASSYKILGPNDMSLYTDNGNVSVLNDNASGNILFAAGASAGVQLLIAPTGNVTISSLGGTGSRAVLADATGLLSAPVSDRNAKMHITNFSNGLNLVMKTNPVNFFYKPAYQHFGTSKQIGFIAQDIKKILPNSTYYNSDGTMGYNEFDLIPVLWKAVQQQQDEIELLKQEIELLKSKK